MNDLLKLESVTLKFDGLLALSNINFTVSENNAKKGMLFGIIGPNGAGKSTFFNLITGIYKPTFGKIFFNNKEIQQLKTTQIVNFGIARTFQNVRLLPHLSVLDNLIVVAAEELKGNFFKSFFGLKTAKILFDDIMASAQSVLQLMGLASYQKKTPNSLPYGDQRKLEIARALMRKPKLLLLDEPAAGMNAVEKEFLYEILKKINSQNIVIIVIEHDMKFIMNLCDHITVLDQGSICAQGTPTQIQNNQQVIDIYLGKKLIHG